MTGRRGARWLRQRRPPSAHPAEKSSPTELILDMSVGYLLEIIFHQRKPERRSTCIYCARDDELSTC